MLATTSLGAIWSSCSPDFGVSGVLDRFGQITPKVLFAADGYRYAGKTLDCMPTVRAVKQQIASIERVVLVPYSERATCARHDRQRRRVRGLRQRGRAAVVRAAAVRSSGLHPVLVRHDGRAEVHRARRRRRAAAADEGAHAALRHGSGRSLLLLHDLRLGDVERARERPRDRRNDRPVRRRAAATGSAGAVAHGARRAHHDLRHQPALPGQLRAGGDPPARASSS